MGRFGLEGGYILGAMPFIAYREGQHHLALHKGACHGSVFSEGSADTDESLAGIAYAREVNCCNGYDMPEAVNDHVANLKSGQLVTSRSDYQDAIDCFVSEIHWRSFRLSAFVVPLFLNLMITSSHVFITSSI